jgi:hypothetical protein
MDEEINGKKEAFFAIRLGYRLENQGLIPGKEKRFLFYP